jgi:uncharacterized RDD family membrane protein YckC
MNPWIAQLTTLAGGRLMAQLESPEGSFGTTATELLFASPEGVRRIKLTGITRIARSGGAVIISGPDAELLRVKLNVPNDALLAFFQTVKSIANQARLLERGRGSAPTVQPEVPQESRPVPVMLGSPVVPSTPAPILEPPVSNLGPAFEPSVEPIPISGLSISSASNFAAPNFIAPNEAVSSHNLPQRPAILPEAPLDTAASSTFWPAPNLGDDAVNNSLDHLRMMTEDTQPQEPAPFRSRLFAAALDGGLFVIAQILISRTLGLWPATPLDLVVVLPERLFNSSAYWGVIGDMASVIGFSLVLSWPYFALLEASKLQGTPGKLALHLYITDLGGRRVDFGRATWRHLSRLVPVLSGFLLWFGGTALALALDGSFGRIAGLSALIVFTLLGLAFPLIAYLRARTDRFGQTLHDQIAGCMVQNLEPDAERSASGASTSFQRDE